MVSRLVNGWVVSQLISQSFGQSIGFWCLLVHFVVIQWDGPTVNQYLTLLVSWSSYGYAVSQSPSLDVGRSVICYVSLSVFR